jgi:hypothetical protein
MSDTVLARLATLKTTSTPHLKQQWRDLFETEPPLYNRRYLESRLAYRIQELAYGGLKPETIERLEALAEQIGRGDAPPHSPGTRPRRAHPCRHPARRDPDRCT